MSDDPSRAPEPRFWPVINGRPYPKTLLPCWQVDPHRPEGEPSAVAREVITRLHRRAVEAGRQGCEVQSSESQAAEAAACAMVASMEATLEILDHRLEKVRAENLELTRRNHTLLDENQKLARQLMELTKLLPARGVA